MISKAEVREGGERSMRELLGVIGLFYVSAVLIVLITYKSDNSFNCILKRVNLFRYGVYLQLLKIRKNIGKSQGIDQIHSEEVNCFSEL